MTFDHDFCLFILLFFSPLFLGVNRKEEKNNQSRGQKRAMPFCSIPNLYFAKFITWCQTPESISRMTNWFFYITVFYISVYCTSLPYKLLEGFNEPLYINNLYKPQELKSSIFNAYLALLGANKRQIYCTF